MRIIHLTVAVVLCSLTVPSVWADNTTCANAEYIFPGEVQSDVLPSGGTIFFMTKVVQGRSYSLASWAPDEDPGEGEVNMANDFFTDNTCAISAQVEGFNDSEPSPANVLGPIFDGHHESLIPNVTGTVWIRIANVVATNAYEVHARFVETTLFSPWWFTGGTNQAFAEIRNTTNTTTDYTATFSTSHGAACGTTSGSLPPNGNTAIRINDFPACDGTSGSAQIAFHGQPNALVANITTIDGVQATSFDAPFRPRMDWGTWLEQ